MTYDASESSRHGGKPIELYKFLGTYANYYYTSGPEAVDFGGHLYLPIAIKRTDISVGTQDDDGLDIQVEMSVQTDLVQVYAFQVSPPRLQLTIYRYHALDDVKVYWLGPVNNIQTSGGRATLRSPSTLGHAMVGNIPNVYYQSPCNHILFDLRCKVVEADNTVEAETTAVAGRLITIDDIGALDGKVIGGELSIASGERRMIVAQDGNDLAVNFPFHALLVGTDVTIVAGCDHLYLGDCKVQFDNQVNFGGFPFVPPENVFKTGIEPGKNVADESCIETTPPVFEGWYLRMRVDFPTSGPGPVLSMPSFYLERLDTNESITGAHLGSGPYGYYDLDIDGLGMTFYFTNSEIPLGTSLDLRLQFGAGQVGGGRPPYTYGTATWKRWSETVEHSNAPTSGAVSLSGPQFDIEGLWPRNYTFLT